MSSLKKHLIMKNDKLQKIYLYIVTLPNDEKIFNAWGMCIEQSLLKDFVQIFKLSSKGELFRVQYADISYFKRLSKIGSILKEKVPSLRNGIVFLENIPKDKFFLVLGSKDSIDLSLNDCDDIARELYQGNNLQYASVTCDVISSNYHIFGWGQSEKRVYVGEFDKNKRVCRFCGKKPIEVTFRDRAHAISEGLGNTKLFCNEECDSCNQKFSKIEQDLLNNLGLDPYILKGKKGYRHLRGETIDIARESEKPIEIKSNQPIISTEDLKSKGLNFKCTESTIRFSPQNSYKCLCKFALSLIDSRWLPRLQKTIDWISSDNFVDKLPPIWQKATNSEEYPLVGLYIRKDDKNTSIPEFIIRLYLQNKEFVYTFPFIDDIKVDISEDVFKDLNRIFRLEQYTKMDYSPKDKQPLLLDFRIKFSEGTDVVEISQKEYESLSEEQLSSLYPNASAFIYRGDFPE